MELFCPDCGDSVPAADVNVQAMVAKCRRCDAVFCFTDAVRAETRANRPDPPGSQPGLLALRTKIDRLGREARDYEWSAGRAAPVYMRLIWRWDMDVPPPVLWQPAVFGSAAGLLFWAMLILLDDARDRPSTHDWVSLICAAVIGLVSGIRQRGRLRSGTFSAWSEATATAG